MGLDRNVSLERVAGRDNEYIIKDSSKITAGRVFILEMVKEHRYCTLRIKFYRNSSSDSILKEALHILLRTLFRSSEMNKVNIMIDEQASISPFVGLGFTMEGILEENIVSNGVYRSELMFGITFSEFEKNFRTSVLRMPGINIDLKLLAPEDSADLLDYNLRNRAHLEPYEPLRDESFYTIDAQRKILMEEYKQYLNGSIINCGIYREGKLIGKIRLSNIVYGVFKSGILGYSMDQNEQGKGFMKEAVGLMTDYCFEEMELHRLEASTLVDNEKSRRVLRSCGFNELGLNKNYLYINGEWRDHITFYKINI